MEVDAHAGSLRCDAGTAGPCHDSRVKDGDKADERHEQGPRDAAHLAGVQGLSRDRLGGAGRRAHHPLRRRTVRRRAPRAPQRAVPRQAHRRPRRRPQGRAPTTPTTASAPAATSRISTGLGADHEPGAVLVMEPRGTADAPAAGPRRDAVPDPARRPRRRGLLRRSPLGRVLDRPHAPAWPSSRP